MNGSVGRRRPVTIYDVAQRAGVSKSLVSLVLRDPEKVGAARREAVQAAIRELGYRPSRVASSLAGQRSNTIGVVIDEFANLWFVELLAGLRAGLEGTSFHVSVADRALNGHLAESPIEGFLAARVDGLVIAGEPGEGTSDDRSTARTWQPQAGDAAPASVTGPAGRDGDERTPVGDRVATVLVGTRLHEVPGADRVVPDDRGGTADAVAHLVELGHERIAFLTGPTGPAAQRERGYRDAMTAAGFPPRVVAAGATTETAGAAAARELLASTASAEISAVVTANDLMALGAWQALREAGMRVPADVSLIGYDDTPVAATGLVQLTSVDPRNDEAGVQAATLLRARIGDPARPPQLVRVAPGLVLRATTGPCPAPPRPRRRALGN